MNMITPLFRLLLLSVICSLSLSAHAGQELPSLKFGGDKSVSFTAIDTLPNGDLVVGGSIFIGKRDRNSDFDWIILRLDPALNIKWVKTFGGPYADSLQRIKALPDGQILLVGDQRTAADRPGKTRQSPWLIRLDPKGEPVWQWSYRKAVGQEARNVSGVLASTIADNGDVVLASIVVDLKQLHNRVQAWVIRVTQQGKVTWERDYGAVNDDRPRSLTTLNNGDLLLAGDFWQVGPNAPTEGMLLRLSGAGDLIWRKQLKAANGLWINATAPLANGNMIVVGRQRSKPEAAHSDPFIKVLDPEGNGVWSYQESGSAKKEYLGITVSKQGEVVVTGSISPGRIGQHDAVIERFTAEGRAVFHKQYDKHGSEYGQALIVNQDGLTLVIGGLREEGEKSWKGLLFSADSRGNLSN